MNHAIDEFQITAVHDISYFLRLTTFDDISLEQLSLFIKRMPAEDMPPIFERFNTANENRERYTDFFHALSKLDFECCHKMTESFIEPLERTQHALDGLLGLAEQEEFQLDISELIELQKRLYRQIATLIIATPQYHHSYRQLTEKISFIDVRKIFEEPWFWILLFNKSDSQDIIYLISSFNNQIFQQSFFTALAALILWNDRPDNEKEAFFLQNFALKNDFFVNISIDIEDYFLRILTNCFLKKLFIISNYLMTTPLINKINPSNLVVSYLAAMSVKDYSQAHKFMIIFVENPVLSFREFSEIMEPLLRSYYDFQLTSSEKQNQLNETMYLCIKNMDKYIVNFQSILPEIFYHLVTSKNTVLALFLMKQVATHLPDKIASLLSSERRKLESLLIFIMTHSELKPVFDRLINDSALKHNPSHMIKQTCRTISFQRRALYQYDQIICHNPEAAALLRESFYDEGLRALSAILGYNSLISDRVLSFLFGSMVEQPHCRKLIKDMLLDNSSDSTSSLQSLIGSSVETLSVFDINCALIADLCLKPEDFESIHLLQSQGDQKATAFLNSYQKGVQDLLLRHLIYKKQPAFRVLNEWFIDSGVKGEEMHLTHSAINLSAHPLLSKHYHDTMEEISASSQKKRQRTTSPL